MSTSNGSLPTPTIFDAKTQAVCELADTLASDLDYLALDFGLMPASATPAIMTKLVSIRQAVASIRKIMDDA